MNSKRFILAGCAVLVLSAGTAQGGPCDTVGKAASAKDAGSGPTVGSTGQTTGASKDVSEHPPTSTNRAAGDVETSSQDGQKQMQGQPTAAQQAQGVEPSAQSADKRLLNTRTPNGFGQARSTVNPSAASTEAVRYLGRPAAHRPLVAREPQRKERCYDIAPVYSADIGYCDIVRWKPAGLGKVPPHQSDSNVRYG